MTILYTDPIFLEHETGRHPENPNRLRSILAGLEKAGLVAQCRRGSFQPIDEKEVGQIHDPKMVARAKELAQCGGGYLDADTVVSPASYQVSLLATGACLAAVDAVMQGTDFNALCLVRPPGHHATPHQSMGFCLFNNIALAAQHARKVFGLSRIFIIDWDVHHGNGTQDIFYEDPEIFFFSIHRYGHGFYPGTGADNETGSSKGLGFNLNAPIAFGTSRKDYHAIFRNTVEKIADQFKPELILISAGFDAHTQDPIGSLGLDTEDFSHLTQRVLEIAKTHSQGRMISCLEGGYHLKALAESVQAHLEELLKHSKD